MVEKGLKRHKRRNEGDEVTLVKRAKANSGKKQLPDQPVVKHPIESTATHCLPKRSNAAHKNRKLRKPDPQTGAAPGGDTPSHNNTKPTEGAAERRSRRSSRKHTKRGGDGKFYDLEEGSAKLSKDEDPAASGAQEDKPSSLPAIANEAQESDTDTRPKIGPSSLDGKLACSLSHKQSHKAERRAPLDSKPAGQKPQEQGADLPKLAVACKEENEASKPAEGLNQKPKTSKKRRPGQKSHRHSENQDPNTAKVKTIVTSPQKLTTCIQGPLSPRQPLASQGQAAIPKAGIPSATLAQSSLPEASIDLPKSGSPPERESPLRHGLLSPSVARPDPSKANPVWFDPSSQAKVQQTEAVLNLSITSDSTAMPLCRDTQANELLQLLNLHLASRNGGSIYISGLPGTGKSLTTHEVAKQCWINAKTKSAAEGLPSIVSINCMSLKQPGAVFMRALAGFQACDTKPQAQPITYPGSELSLKCPDAQEALKEYAQLPMGTPIKKGKSIPHMLILILDELDQLRSQDCSILYTLFSLPQAQSSRLILIGISNSIDIVERRLPRLREMGTHPHAIPFPSYSALQVADILRQRLAALPGPVFQDAAITFCAKKIASQSGDMRRALEACSVALSNAVAERAKKPSESAAEGNDGQEAFAARKSRLVGIGDMAKAISSLRGGSGEASAVVQAMRALPQQQQVVLCAASKLLGQAEVQAAEVPKGPTTPQSLTKAARPRMASFMSPSYSQTMRTPSGKGVKASTPKTPSSAQFSRLSVLGSMQECVLGKLHESYCHLCRQASLRPLNGLEFAAACSNLADMGIMTMASAKEERLRKISLRAHKDDVALAFQDVRMLRSLLSLS